MSFMKVKCACLKPDFTKGRLSYAQVVMILERKEKMTLYTSRSLYKV